MFIQILKERGLKSLINEIVDNYIYDFLNNVETHKRVGKSTKLYTYYGPVYYSVIKESFQYIQNINQLILIDIGCGKGKVLFTGLNFGFKSIIGIDIKRNLLVICRKNINGNKKLKNNKEFIKLININAIKYKITNENVFFLNNPFSEIILNKFLKQIILSFRKNKRKIYLIYANPLEKNKILNKQFKKIKTIYRNTYITNIYRL
jgi:16S rRNA G966 N2-methylase RsmD